MANGDIVLKDDVLHVKLVDGATATTTQAWIDVGPYSADLGIHIQGIAGGSVVQIWGDSVSTVIPGAGVTTTATQIGANITADAHVSLSAPPRFLAAIVSTFGSGTVNVFSVSRKR